MESDLKKNGWYHLIPIAFLIAVVPLIVRLKDVPLVGASYEFWTGERVNMDFFSYYKMVWIIICAVATLIVLFLKFYKNNFKPIKRTYFFIPIGVYTLFIILSTIFSEYKQISLGGFVDRYEGMYVLLAYMIVLFAVINLVQEEKHIRVLLGALFFSAFVLGVIGLFQYLGYDIWKLGFGKDIMIPSKFDKLKEGLSFKFDKYSIYGTLYHRDYVGSYMAMLFPLTFAIFLLMKNKLGKIGMGLLTVLMFINLFGSHSRAGIVGTIGAFVFLLIMINKYILRNWKYFLAGLLVFTVIFGVFDKISDNSISSRVKSIVVDAKKMISSDEKDEVTEEIPLKDIIIQGDTASVITTTEELKIETSNGQIGIKDGEDNPIPFKFIQEEGKILLQSEQYSKYDITIGKMNDKNVLIIKKEQIRLYFSLFDDGVKLLNSKGKEVELKEVEKWGFEGKDRLGSSRGYIWSRSIPLLKDTKLLGYGPDTFAIYFPQYDLKGKMYAYYGDMWHLVDKPHNLFLQIGLNTGLISLLAVLVLFIMYTITSVQVYIRNEYNDFTSIAGVGIFSAVIGYLGAAFFNDSVVSVAPVFWVLLGIGISINITLKKRVAA